MKVLECGLCKGRHEMPVDEYIFPQVIDDPTDLDSLERTCEDFIRGKVREGYRGFVLYVTGMTVCLTTFVKVLGTNPFGYASLTLRHYDAKSGEYYSQKMW